METFWDHLGLGRWLWLLIFVVLIPKEALADSSALAVKSSGKYSLFLLEAKAGCQGSLFLTSPDEKLITDRLQIPYLTIEVGRFAAGQSLSFKVRTNCAALDLDSGNPDHLEVVEEENTFILVWKDPQSPQDFLFLMILSLSEPGLPVRHPVIFVHGLGGHWSDWEEGGNKEIYFKTLKATPYNYPEEFLHAYRYSDADGNPETYDNQGDIKKIAVGLKDEVDRLAELYYTGCRKDCVDLVGFSLGGIVMRQYLNDHPEDHKIRKVITIASPHRGAEILNFEDYIRMVPAGGEVLEGAINELISKILQAGGWANIDLNSDAAQQVRSSSDFINQINETTIQNVDIRTLFGNIDAEFKQRVFFIELKKKFSIGDLLISTISASGIPASQLEKIEFSDPRVLDLNIRLSKDGTVFQYVIDLPSLDDIKFYHGNLVKQPEVSSKVVNILTSDYHVE